MAILQRKAHRAFVQWQVRVKCAGGFEVGVGWVGTPDGGGRTETEEPDGEVSLILSSRAFTASCRTVSTEADPQVFSSFTLRSAAYASRSATLFR